MTGTNAGSINDCNGTCSTNNTGNVLDRDPTGGEWLLEHRGTPRNSDADRVAVGYNYRVSQVTAPSGYEWIVSGTNTKTIGGSNDSSASWGGDTYNFGTFQVRAKSYSITVKKGSYRTGTGSDNISTENTVGVQFGLFTTSTGGTPSFTCEIAAATPGDCVFPEVIVSSTTNFYVRELPPAAGTPAAANFTYPITQLSTGAYNLRTGDLTAGGSGSITLPGVVSDTTSGRFANRQNNPVLAQTCNAGVKVAIVLDTSGSISGYQNTLAQATTALINGIAGTPSSVAMFSFANNSAGAVANHPALQSVLTTTGANTVKGWYSTNNGQQANFTPNGATNWDMGLWKTAQGSQSNNYDIVFVLTDGNPTRSNDPVQGPGNATYTRELERAIFSANALKKTGARVVTVGIGGNLSDYNLGSISGPDKYQAGDGINDFDYITADWAQLEQVMKTFAQGLTCESTVTVEKQAKPYQGTQAPASGWEFDFAQSGAQSATPVPATSKTDANGQVVWTLKFQNPGDVATNLSLTELENRAGWSLKSISCTDTGANPDLQNKTVALSDIGIGKNVKCTFVNEESQVGSLAISKAFDASVPTGSGTEVNFTGAYSCKASVSDPTVVASGTWSRVGTGAATLTPTLPTGGTAGASQPVPANAVCSTSEDPLPTTDTGLPNSSWKWGTPTIGADVPIVNGQTATTTVTNKAERVYGNFSITKDVPTGSVVDAGMTFGGNWSCVLGPGTTAETKTGTWGPIAPGGTWTSTDANQIPLGSTCTATETGRPDKPVTDGSYEWDGDPVITPTTGVTTKTSELEVITVTNKSEQVPGSVIWNKVDGSTKLAGSEWLLKGPGQPDEGTPVTDCVAQLASSCIGPDQDPLAGQFKLEYLLWGEYELVETKAPSGYQLDTTPHRFEVGKEGVIELNLGNIANVPVVPPTIPLTGGLGRDAFLIAGASAVLLGAAGVVWAQHRRSRKEVI